MQSAEHPAPEIRDLSFRYAADAPLVLDRLRWRCNPANASLSGESGAAGRPTLVNLLLRFWDYEGGQIALGGHELRDYDQTDVRPARVMTQRTYLFNTTIRENIHIARTAASPEEIELAARQAEIHDFILSLPDGYDTVVGEDGGRLQRRRASANRVSARPAEERADPDSGRGDQ
ncbi:MAG: ATP-binding cassette domain-containing protein [Anaerolineae bacterium]